MKKTKINLLISREDYRKLENFFYRLRILVAVVGIIFFGILLFFFTFLSQQNKTITSLLEQKKLILQSLKNKENEEAKIVYLGKKYLALKEFIKDDANFLPYYNLLNSALSEATQSAELKLFKITKNREADFTVNFDNFSQVMSFFKFIESETFLKNFEKIVLKSFSINTDEIDKKENYELTFTGHFIPINENKN